MTKKIKLVVCDHHQIVRNGILKLAQDFPDLEVVGEASCGKDVIEKVKNLNPDVVLLTIDMPGLNGLQALPFIKEAHSDCQVIMFTTHDNTTYALEALKRGATGYLLKTATNKEIYIAIKKTSQGEIYLSSEIDSSILKSYTNGQEAQSKEKNKYNLLSNREQQVLILLLQDYSSKDIAKLLYISPRTIEKHKANLMKKIEVTDTISMVRFAIKTGIIDPEIW